jgi:hypothetical protein
MQEVSGSIPLGSTKKISPTYRNPWLNRRRLRRANLLFGNSGAVVVVLV